MDTNSDPVDLNVISVHAAVLASFIPSLSSLRQIDLPGQIVLQKFTMETVNMFLEYLYTGTVY